MLLYRSAFGAMSRVLDLLIGREWIQIEGPHGFIKRNSQRESLGLGTGPRRWRRTARPEDAAQLPGRTRDGTEARDC